jgi:hypothetical protein
MSGLVFGLFDTDPFIKKIQCALNELLHLDLTCDGNIGKVTQEAIGNYQKSIGVVETDSRGAVYGAKTHAVLGTFIANKYLTDQDYSNAANALGTNVATVKTITSVEAKQFGFLKNGFPVTLFERHKFYAALVKNKGAVFATKITATEPDICNHEPGGYSGGVAEQTRLERAIAIDKVSAISSASYGLFQIMGFNFLAAGYPDPVSYFEAIKLNERNQLNAFVAFVKNNSNIRSALVDHKWSTFALLYNGPNYKINNYDTKLSAAYTLNLGTS